MTKELIVNVKKESVAIALLEDNALVEYSKEDLKEAFVVGNIYLGRVRKLLPGLNAAFIDIGSEREAFIHYHDLGQNFNTFNSYIQQIINNRKATPKFEHLEELPKDGKIQDVLKQGQYIMVQIVKEAINTKGPRLTAEISIAGRNMVLLPLGEKVNVSQKIKSHEEKNRLRKIVSSIKKRPSGVIIRTVAVDKQMDELDTELRVIERKWDKIVDNLRAAKTFALLYEEQNRIVSVLRDLFDPEFEAIHVDNEEVQTQIKNYLEMLDSSKTSIVKLYSGELPIFDHFGVTRQLKSLFGRTVSFKRGAYLIFDKAEAMHVIDVNSGARTKSDQSQEENAIEINIAAATEIARQFRLRDMGGIIVIDFIDMVDAAHRTMLYEHMCQVMKSDRAKHNILPLSKFGLMQITRQRVRAVADVHTQEVCPTCNGTGHIKSSLLLTEQIEDAIIATKEVYSTTKFNIYVHPYLYAYLKKGFISQLFKWKAKYGMRIKIIPDQDLGMVQYRITDRKGDEMILKGLD